VINEERGKPEEHGTPRVKKVFQGREIDQLTKNDNN
jgi:hypothetical protein